MQHEVKLFDFIQRNHREEKPRSVGVTEIRGPYYSVMGKRYLEDVLETMGDWRRWRNLGKVADSGWNPGSGLRHQPGKAFFGRRGYTW